MVLFRATLWRCWYFSFPWETRCFWPMLRLQLGKCHRNSKPNFSPWAAPLLFFFWKQFSQKWLLCVLRIVQQQTTPEFADTGIWVWIKQGNGIKHFVRRNNLQLSIVLFQRILLQWRKFAESLLGKENAQQLSTINCSFSESITSVKKICRKTSFWEGKWTQRDGFLWTW